MPSYSQSLPIILDETGRLRIARQVLKILSIHAPPINTKKVLDIACSSGVITNFLAPNVKSIIGIDIDDQAISRALTKYHQPNLKFQLANALALNFPDNSFDIVIANQVYEFVSNQSKLASEIHRVLKPQGVCLLGARNLLTPVEGQTHLPLIHFLPASWSVSIAKLFSKTYHPAHYLTWWQLRRLFGSFSLIDLTPQILSQPHKYDFVQIAKQPIISKINTVLPPPIQRMFYPNFIWLLYPIKPKQIDI